MRIQQGFTFIEVMLFALVIGTLGSIMWISYQEIILHADGNSAILKATLNAEARLELILAAKRRQGFSNFTDPCDTSSPPDVCEHSQRVVPASLPLNSEHDQALVTVRGASTDNVQIELSVLLGNDG